MTWKPLAVIGLEKYEINEFFEIRHAQKKTVLKPLSEGKYRILDYTILNGVRIYRTHEKKYNLPRIKKMYYSGMPLQQIAVKCEMSLAVLSKITSRLRRRRSDNAKIGENHNVAVLTEKDVISIYNLFLQDISVGDISKKYPVSAQHIRHILKGLSWKNTYIAYASRLESCQTHIRSKKIAMKKAEISWFKLENATAQCSQCGLTYPCKHTKKPL
jgi:predicted DNA-binding protein YlxM (UPF0122 family)